MSDDEVFQYFGQKFEWNRMKAMRNVVAHGVRFPEAATVFFDKDALFDPDEEHSADEQRYTIVGRSIHLRSLFVVHVERGERIRIISARVATEYERSEYEARLGR
jgi:uncharacterized DUF497 family protein